MAIVFRRPDKKIGVTSQTGWDVVNGTPVPNAKVREGRVLLVIGGVPTQKLIKKGFATEMRRVYDALVSATKSVATNDSVRRMVTQGVCRVEFGAEGTPSQRAAEFLRQLAKVAVPSLSKWEAMEKVGHFRGMATEMTEEERWAVIPKVYEPNPNPEGVVPERSHRWGTSPEISCREGGGVGSLINSAAGSSGVRANVRIKYRSLGKGVWDLAMVAKERIYGGAELYTSYLLPLRVRGE